jgi:hypothetical protein
VIAGFSSKIFPVKVRYTAISASYQLGGAIFGGFTPIIGVLLADRFASQWLPLAIFYSILAAISFTGVFLLHRYGFGTSEHKLIDKAGPADSILMAVSTT